MVKVTTILALITAYAGVSMALLSNLELDSSLSLLSPINKDPSHLKSWHLSGSASIDSSKNRLSLTSLTEANQRGSIWSQNPIPYNSFKFSVSLDVSGPVNPGGGLAIWYSKNPGETGPVHGSRDFWDGLAIMVDYDARKVDGKGGEGMIRGHLNDGSINYNEIALKDDISKQSFSMCKINYRNTGAPFVIDIFHEPGNLTVNVNGQNCFTSDKIQLEPFGFLGVSADSTENPDSFSVYSVSTYQDSEKIHERPGRTQQRPYTDSKIPNTPINNQIKKQDIISQEALDKMATSEHISDILSQMERLSSNMDRQLQKLGDEIREVKTVKDVLKSVNDRISKLEEVVVRLDVNYQSSTAQKHEDQKQQLNEATKKLHSKIEEIHRYFETSSNNLLNVLPTSVSQSIINDGPSIWRAIMLMFIVQGAGFIGYIVYKNKKEARHEKWL
ncbi:concanavalin A-like lectin/glucanase [Nadsonia fulvescens var. elongata DSM 6958]|uniref:Concanavalin A-like lectin/glucanase n=1 Tax=Nadsonia fulvescens var. elongata DSM 6958 TaxID=857566 RepID=A0A1E3PH26_9ASCO|nr:concanavalin A-like lectin/glucanase [Nadsonia fulvescens var. elongata DSM 6958]